MRSVVHKLFFIWELDKEANWINDMADHGFGLVKAGRLSFEFDDVEPGKYIYGSIFLSGSGYSSKNTEYYKFLEEMGITMINRINYPGTCCVYLRALKEDFPNGIDLYSDIDSKITYERTLMWYLLFVAILNLVIGIYNCIVVSIINGRIMPANLFCSFLSFAIFIASTIYFIKKLVRINKLKKERKIHE